MAQSSVTLMRTAFPLYSINMISNRYMMISGGGGAANTGVLNTIVMYNFVVINNLILIILSNKSFI